MIVDGVAHRDGNPLTAACEPRTVGRHQKRRGPDDRRQRYRDDQPRAAPEEAERGLARRRRRVAGLHAQLVRIGRGVKRPAAPCISGAAERRVTPSSGPGVASSGYVCLRVHRPRSNRVGGAPVNDEGARTDRARSTAPTTGPNKGTCPSTAAASPRPFPRSRPRRPSRPSRRAHRSRPRRRPRTGRRPAAAPALAASAASAASPDRARRIVAAGVTGGQHRVVAGASRRERQAPR